MKTQAEIIREMECLQEQFDTLDAINPARATLLTQINQLRWVLGLKQITDTLCQRGW